jgi:simple sugar transport system substrate-binding protein
MKRIILAGFSIVFLLAASFFAFAEGAPESETGKRYKFIIVSHNVPGYPFWEAVQSGMEDAAALLGVDATMQYSEGDYAKQVDFIEAAIAAKVDGIATTIVSPDAFDDPIQKALNAGIPTIALNSDDPEGAAGNPRLCFVGQDFTEAGYTLGKAMASHLSRGDHVGVPTGLPAASWAQKRYAGVKRALDEKGISSELIDVGSFTASDVLSRVSAYLQGHPETDALIALDAIDNETVPLAISELGLEGKVIAGGFDITETIYKNIKEGKTLYGVDQQGYSQGFLSIVTLLLAVAKNQTPVDINTGNALVSKDTLYRWAPVYEK